MTRQTRQTQKKSKAEQLEIVIRFLNAGKTQAEAAAAAAVNIRTVQRWIREPESEAKLSKLQQEADAIVKSDPVVLSVTEIRQQVDQILQYRESQRSFALEMGVVIEKATAVLLKAVERLEENPEEMTARNIPQLLRAVVDAAEKVSNAWGRATGLDDLLENLNEPKVVNEGSKEA